MRLPERLELGVGVPRDDILDSANVGLVELGEAGCTKGRKGVRVRFFRRRRRHREETALRTLGGGRGHELDELGVVERHASQNFETGRGDTALWGSKRGM